MCSHFQTKNKTVFYVGGVFTKGRRSITSPICICSWTTEVKSTLTLAVKLVQGGRELVWWPPSIKAGWEGVSFRCEFWLTSGRSKLVVGQHVHEHILVGQNTCRSKWAVSQHDIRQTTPHRSVSYAQSSLSLLLWSVT